MRESSRVHLVSPAGFIRWFQPGLFGGSSRAGSPALENLTALSEAGHPARPDFVLFTGLCLVHRTLPCSPNLALLTEPCLAHRTSPCSPAFALLTEPCLAHRTSPCSPAFALLTRFFLQHIFLCDVFLRIFWISFVYPNRYNLFLWPGSLINGSLMMSVTSP